MSEAAAIHAEANESPLTPESWGKLGMWVFLVGDAMSFGTLLAGYGAIRYGSADWPKPYEVLGIWLTAGMTFLFIGIENPVVTAPNPPLGNAIGAASGLAWAFTVIGLRRAARGRSGASSSSARSAVPQPWPD